GHHPDRDLFLESGAPGNSRPLGAGPRGCRPRPGPGQRRGHGHGPPAVAPPRVLGPLPFAAVPGASAALPRRVLWGTGGTEGPATVPAPGAAPGRRSAG